MSKELSLKQVKQLPYKTLNRLINKAKNFLKNDEVWKKICKEHDEEPEIIDLIPTRFGNLDVSAKTDHGIVILNYKLLCDGDFTKDYSYLIHEYSHWFQQCYGTKPTKSSDDGAYLDNPFEQEGFQNQIEYISKQEGPEEAEDYVENLLDHHEVDSDKERDKKKEVLMSKI